MLGETFSLGLHLLAAVLLVGLHAHRAHVLVRAAGPVRLLDGPEAGANLDSLGRVVCQSADGREGQLSRQSTIRRLHEHFESSVGPGHPLLACKEQHGEALRTLAEVLAASQENVCSEEKLSLIEDYHNQFVSTQLEHVEARQRQQRDTAPHLLNLFFMHYAMEVDALCKRTLINNLEWDLKDKFGDDMNERLFMFENQFSDEERATFGKIFKGCMNKFTDLYAIRNYDDAVLVWDLLKGSVLSQEHDEQIRDELDETTGEPIRLKVKVKSARYLNKIRSHCHYTMKPIYGKLILPIMRLSDLGYANTGEQFKIELDELRTNENVKRWYATTQLCEALLPVMFYEDQTLAPEEIVVISKQEVEELTSSSQQADSESEREEEPPVMLEYEPQTNTMLGVDKLESVESKEAQNMVKKVKANVSTRDRAVNRAVVHLLRNLKHQFRESRVGKFFFSKRTTKLANPNANEKEAHFDKQEVSSQFAQSLDQISEQDLLKLDGASPSRLIRSCENANGIGKRRRHRRKGDVDMVMEMRADAISYRRTKTWSEIFTGWAEALSVLAPSRTQLIIAGSLIIGLLLLVLVASLFASITAGMG